MNATKFNKINEAAYKAGVSLYEPEEFIDDLDNIEDGFLYIETTGNPDKIKVSDLFKEDTSIEVIKRKMDFMKGNEETKLKKAVLLFGEHLIDSYAFNPTNNQGVGFPGNGIFGAHDEFRESAYKILSSHISDVDSKRKKIKNKNDLKDFPNTINIKRVLGLLNPDFLETLSSEKDFILEIGMDPKDMNIDDIINFTMSEIGSVISKKDKMQIESLQKEVYIYNPLGDISDEGEPLATITVVEMDMGIEELILELESIVFDNSQSDLSL